MREPWSATSILTSVAVLVILVALAHAEFLAPPAAPIDRLRRNLEARLAEHKDDVTLQYKLARTYYLAFSCGTKLVPMEVEKQEPASWHRTKRWVEHLRSEEAARLANDSLSKRGIKATDGNWLEEHAKLYFPTLERLCAEKWLPEPLTKKEALDFAERSFCLYAKCLESKPCEPLFLLGKASLCDALLPFRDTLSLVPKWLTNFDRKAIADLYFGAFEEAMTGDSRLREVPITGHEALISFEAAERFLDLTAGMETEGERRTRAKDGVTLLRKIPQLRITPLAIPLGQDKSESQLISATARVRFDIDFDGIKDCVQWFTPRAGILVWDVGRTGVVLDGTQLFGTVTFGLIHLNGFEALALLDDNGDGTLRGAELLGIAIWVDLNCNGITENGEVRDFLQFGGIALAVGPVQCKSGVPWVEKGALLGDGWSPVFDMHLAVDSVQGATLVE